MRKNNEWWIVNTILLIIIIIILLSRCNKNYKQIDLYNIDTKENCIIENNKLEENDEIIIEDKNGNYIYQKKLDIFENSFFKGKNVIAPGVSNTYDFNVHNKSDNDIKYLIKIDNISNDIVNLKYRLKRNGKYIIGSESEWVTSKELNTNYNKLKEGKTDNYSLDWKWFDNDELDNYVGENIVSKYILNINIYLE